MTRSSLEPGRSFVFSNRRDLNLALGSAVPLAPASRKSVRIALGSLVAVLNAVSNHYLNTASSFDAGDSAGGALSLLYVIDDGVRADTERRARHGRGEIDFDELRIREL